MARTGDGDFDSWLRDRAGVTEWRRVVRDDGKRILLSKFDEGFAAGVHELITQMPELADRQTVRAAYGRACLGAIGRSRVDVWHEMLQSMLRRAGTRLSLTSARQAEVRAGIESVYVILQTALWSDPKVGEPHHLKASEQEAYQEALLSMADGDDRFSRNYGWYQDRQVVNHCPAAAFARILLEQGWHICSTEDAVDASVE